MSQIKISNEERLLRAEKREIKCQKRKNAPTGGTLAGQIQRMEVARKYRGKKS